MKYEIAYISSSGNTEKLAHGIADCLPCEDTFVTNLFCEEITKQADVYLLGFGMKHEAIPLKIMDVLDELEGKTILFFVTAPIKPTEAHVKEVERKLEPFMPNNCDYRGLFLCLGQVSEKTLMKLRTVLEQEPDNEQAKAAYETCQQTVGHPNQKDFEDAYDFVCKKLNVI